MEVKERLIGRTFCHEIDRMLALETFYSLGYIGRDACLGSVGCHLDRGNLLALGSLGRTIDPYIDGEWLCCLGCDIEVDGCVVALLCSFECCKTLGSLSQTLEAEILETYYTLVADVGEIHVIVPPVPAILHPLIVGHVASIACRIVFIWVETIDAESLGSYFCACVFISVSSLSCPYFIFGKWVITSDHNLATVGYRCFVPFNLDRSHHSLTSIAEAARRTMIEHIPLTIDLLNRAVCVVGCIGSDESLAIRRSHHATRVNEHATRTPRTKRRVTISIAESRVGAALSVFRTAVAREHHHVFVANLTY